MKRRKVLLGCLSAILVVLVGLGIFAGPAIFDLWPVLSPLLSGQKMRTYSGNSEQNLKALYVAMMLYHQSEGAFPASSGWMDAIANRLKTSDMTQEEANKKFVDPTLPAAPGVFGYAMNDAASGKYQDDVKDPSRTPLLFVSSDTSRNAHGSPSRLAPTPPRRGGNLGISVSGKILHL